MDVYGSILPNGFLRYNVFYEHSFFFFLSNSSLRMSSFHFKMSSIKKKLGKVALYQMM